MISLLKRIMQSQALEDQLAMLRSLQDEAVRKKDVQLREEAEKKRREKLGLPPVEEAEGPAKASSSKEKTEESETKEIPNEPETKEIPPTKRFLFFYQLVVCYVCTLVPSWNPRPEYIGLPPQRAPPRPAGDDDLD